MLACGAVNTKSPAKPDCGVEEILGKVFELINVSDHHECTDGKLPNRQ